MKLGHNQRAAVEHRLGKPVPIRKFREWQVGVVLFVVGNLANFISFGYAAQSLLAALGSVQFVSNVVFASVVLKEKINRTIVGATGCIVMGCVMLVFFGSHSSKQFTVDELMHLYSEPTYIGYLVCLASVVLFMYAVYKCGKKKMLYGLSVGVSGLNHYWYRVLPVSYATFSGMIGTQSVLFSKTLSTLLRVTLGGNSQLQSWFTWVIICLFLVTSTFWISRLNKALKFFPAMIIVPTMQISWTFFSIISGMLYFQEYCDFTLYNGIMFTAAVMIVFFGVFLLTKTRVIEQKLSTRLSSSIEEGKRVDDSDSDESQRGRASVERSLNCVSPWQEEDIRSPIVHCDHSTAPPVRSPSDQLNNSCGDAHEQLQNTPTSHLVIIEDDDEDLPVTSTNGGSLLVNVAEDFSLDVWSTCKGTVGMGPDAAPALTLFGPPGVGFEKGPSSPVVHLTVSCGATSSADASATSIVHLTNEPSLRA